MSRGVPRAAVAVVLLVLLSACAQGGGREGGHEAPRDGQAGLQLTGSFAGRQLALSDGAPTLLAGGTCQQRIGLAADLCFASRDIDGTGVIVSFLNPEVLQPGATLPVGQGACRTLEQCAQVTEVAVIEVQVGGQRQRASSGRLSLGAVTPGQRYVGTATLGFRRGELSGSFDIVPRPEG